jgi:Ca2+-binding RTX toxin-like protein
VWIKREVKKDPGGTKERVSLTGKNRLADIFEGSADANTLLMTDDDNGDGLFVDDIYSASPNELGLSQSRIARIDEIRAGAGDDIVDMTSNRIEYIGSGLTIRGGDGNDVLWANKGENFLFGDSGNDRIVGASGNDVIVGGIGNDRMHGGGGNDVFAFCNDWGADKVEQLGTGTVTLWFASGSEDNWNAETLTYADGEDSVTVKGITADRITLKFGDDGSNQYKMLAAAGSFAEFTSQKIFEESQRGILVGSY